jgi:hypothetical protein
MNRGACMVGILVACGSDPATVARESSCEVQQSIPMSVMRKLDLLFVIDDSPGMAARQATVAANLPRLMDVLTTVEGGLDLHIGVVTTDLAKDGRLQSTPRVEGCAPPDGAFIRHRIALRGGLETNVSGELRDAFPCIAELGAAGGEPRPLEALRRALEHPENAGFVRPDAYLGVILVSSVDDATPAGWLSTVKADPHLVVVSVVAPPEATHLGALVGFQGVFRSIDQDDFTDVLLPFAQPLARVLGVPCLIEVDTTDVLPAEAGLQLGCAVEIGRYRGLARVDTRTMPRCRIDAAGGPVLDSLPCWWVRPDSLRCDPGYTSGHELVLELADWPDPGTVVDAHCPAICR